MRLKGTSFDLFTNLKCINKSTELFGIFQNIKDRIWYRGGISTDAGGFRLTEPVESTSEEGPPATKTCFK